MLVEMVSVHLVCCIIVTVILYVTLVLVSHLINIVIVH